jgi:hypothetical protein
MGTVVIREYEQRFMADSANGLLEEAGIPSMISADDIGGSYPQIVFSRGYRVLINEEDREAAEEVLSVLGAYEPPRHQGLFS